LGRPGGASAENAAAAKVRTATAIVVRDSLIG
jgi:hypothetical protein